jgi:hypothetical protein
MLSSGKVDPRLNQGRMGAGVGEKQSRSYTTTMASSRKSLQLYDSLTKAESAILVQFRTGKIGFQAYLAAIGASDSALCNCRRSPQTIKHVLMECQEYDALRIRTWTGDGAGIPRTLNAFLTDPKRVKKTTQFVLNTGLIPYLANEGGADAAASSSSTPGGTVQ